MTLITLTEVCRMTGATPRALRVWEGAGLLGEVARDPRDRRLYTAQQVELVKAVLVGQLAGLTLAEMKQITKHWSIVEERKMRYRVRELIERLNFLMPPERELEYDL